MKIYISTANQYTHLLKPFAYLFNTFWDDSIEITVIGYERFNFNLPKNFKFISLGTQEGGIQRWSTDLRKFFESIDDNFFIWATEDQFITYPVEQPILKHITENYLTPDMGRFGLTNDNKGRPYNIIEQLDNCKIIESGQTVNYRLSALWSIWNREYLLKYLLPGYSPGEFEVKGSDIARNDGYKILGTVDNYVIHASLGVRKGNLNVPLNFKFINDNRSLEQNVIDEMKYKGVINEENRVSE